MSFFETDTTQKKTIKKISMELNSTSACFLSLYGKSNLLFNCLRFAAWTQYNPLKKCIDRLIWGCLVVMLYFTAYESINK